VQLLLFVDYCCLFYFFVVTHGAPGARMVCMCC
jgi:hypothetical protein